MDRIRVNFNCIGNFVTTIEPLGDILVPSESENSMDTGGSSDVFQIVIPGEYGISVEPRNNIQADIYRIVSGLFHVDQLVMQGIRDGYRVTLPVGFYRLKNPQNIGRGNMALFTLHFLELSWEQVDLNS